MRFHIGLDSEGQRRMRMRGVAEIRRARTLRLLVPVVVGQGRSRWRNGLHQRRWLLIAAQVRGDRCCFLMTLPRPPLVPPLPPF